VFTRVEGFQDSMQPEKGENFDCRRYGSGGLRPCRSKGGKLATCAALRPAQIRREKQRKVVARCFFRWM
jgi:hypothetical protein